MNKKSKIFEFFSRKTMESELVCLVRVELKVTHRTSDGEDWADSGAEWGRQSVSGLSSW